MSRNSEVLRRKASQENGRHFEDAPLESVKSRHKVIRLFPFNGIRIIEVGTSYTKCVAKTLYSAIVRFEKYAKNAKNKIIGFEVNLILNKIIKYKFLLIK